MFFYSVKKIGFLTTKRSFMYQKIKPIYDIYRSINKINYENQYLWAKLVLK